MTKETTKKSEQLEFQLRCGKKLTIDLSKAKENVIFNCRIAGQEKVVIYIMSEIGLFDGEKIPAPELLNILDMFDVMELEGIWSELEKVCTKTPNPEQLGFIGHFYGFSEKELLNMPRQRVEFWFNTAVKIYKKLNNDVQ